MTYTSERLYNEVIRWKMPRFSSTIRVREILPHLPCLTLTDREEIEAKRETAGNSIAVQTLLDNLRRRENWPDEFITALWNCEHRELAEEISAAYDRIRGMTNNAVAAAVPSPAPTPAPAPTSSATGATVTTATIHTFPVTSPPLLTLTSVEAPAHSVASSNTAAQVPPPAVVLQGPQSKRIQQVEVPTPVPSPSPVPTSQAEMAPPVLALSQAIPPTAVSASKVTSPVQKNDISTHTWAAENKTTIVDTPDGLALTSQTTSTFTDDTILSTLSAQASSPETSQNQTTSPCSTSQGSPRSEKSQVPIAVKETIPSERYPVQDTNPPLKEQTVVQGPEEISDLTANELVQRTNTVGLPVFKAQTTFKRTTQATCSAPAEVDTYCHPSIDQEYFSKPGTLQHPKTQQRRAEAHPVLQEEPCSVISDELEISRSAVCSTEPGQFTTLAEHPGIESNNSPEPFPSAKIPVECVDDPNLNTESLSYTNETSSHIACLEAVSQSIQENGSPLNAPLSPNQPVEDHYESFCVSQTEPGTLINVIHIAEEPPAEKSNGQPPSILGNAVNPGGVSANIKPCTVISEDHPTLNHQRTENVVHLHEPSKREASDHKKSATIKYQEQESNATRPGSNLQLEQREMGRASFQINIFHLCAAAGIGLTAIVLAWKLKH
ncbi:mitochondrial antiviral-signaling protein-like isoform X2 [Myxocyprinus asiaticus]|nr:mitochondrial antiviral-signaling protein-like isoform X2 [Myxocyprinus asiaticus]XP_051508066.1 mitochondrial antiviral-signaling protein-like isoform X2 [Myxocyprinus asiaticus]XP_051508067.1 mitochondrial antiviral-signaling protein-like isoform X2 [Myxocyprinus asiaticus]XP_051508068.1 mitochondrial antiviral-signaling protein-like isoform X2 [Myxocyprinus asiaticus]